MKIINLLLLINFLIIVSSCNDNGSQNEKLHDSLMKGHDAEMAKMEIIHQLRKRLKSIDDTITEGQEKFKIQEKLNRLNNADEAMMNWMRNYKEPEESVDSETKKEYFLQELHKIKSIKVLMDSSINSAKTYLNIYENETK